jgi:hypothetical protein
MEFYSENYVYTLQSAIICVVEILGVFQSTHLDSSRNHQTVKLETAASSAQQLSLHSSKASHTQPATSQTNMPLVSPLLAAFPPAVTFSFHNPAVTIGLYMKKQ